MQTEFSHQPVLLNEVIEFLNVKPDGVYLDCTGGAGGHSQAILGQLSSSGKMFVCDYHKNTVLKLKEKFADDGRVQVFHVRFSEVFDNLDSKFDGILADFGISSPQLENQDLGIGFQVDDAPLDMRIDHSLQKSAADLLNELSEEDLANVFFEYGGERASRKIAAAIVFDRKQQKHYTTTTELRELCERVLGRFYRGKKIHPATKVFQALRIAVNDELGEVKALLQKAPQSLNSNGRLALISFHSGEDRLVKTKFKELSQTDGFRLPVKKAIKPSLDEIKLNPRARSARLRVLEKVSEETL